MTGARSLFVQYLRQRQELGDRELLRPPGALEALAAASREIVTATPESAAGLVREVALKAPREAAPENVPRAAPARPIRDRLEHVAAPPLVRMGSLDELRSAAIGCTACGLAKTRSTVVFGEGDAMARLVVVGEAPGADEDRAGRPFVGRAGKLLDTLLMSIGLPRETVYICNVLKCRPPNNRNPQPDEVHTCSPFLRGQLAAISPRAILAVGAFPAQTLLNTTEPIGRLRGAVHSYEGVPLLPTYHPAFLLRNSNWIRTVWEDLQRLRDVLDR